MKIRLCLQEDEAHVMGGMTRKRRRTSFNTTIVTLTGERPKVDVTRNMTVLQLKWKIRDQVSTHPDQQRLIACRTQLEDEACLGDYLDKASTLILSI